MNNTAATVTTAPLCSFCLRSAAYAGRARVGSHAGNVEAVNLCQTHKRSASGTVTKIDARVLTMRDALDLSHKAGDADFDTLKAAGRLLRSVADRTEDDAHASYLAQRANACHRAARIARNVAEGCTCEAVRRGWTLHQDGCQRRRSEAS